MTVNSAPRMKLRVAHLIPAIGIHGCDSAGGLRLRDWVQYKVFSKGSVNVEEKIQIQTA